eukprot:s5357_g1.t1
MRGLGRWQRLRYAWGINRARGRTSSGLGFAVEALGAKLIFFPIFRLQARRERKRLEEKLKADAEKVETGTEDAA